MYTPTKWEDHTNSLPGIFKVVVYDEANDLYRITEGGTVMVQGTPQDQTNFGNMEAGILDAQTATALLLNYARQNAWEMETGTVTLTNSLAFPFNNSKKTISLATRRESTNYVVLADVAAFTGNAGELEISDKLTNGFKLAYTGSASSVTVNYTVIGGYMK